MTYELPAGIRSYRNATVVVRGKYLSRFELQDAPTLWKSLWNCRPG